MRDNLRVVSLQAQNIMRLSAVEVLWDKDQSLVMVGGRNGAGKSSVLNAVAMALGGAALCPEEPIRRGEATGFVELDLGGLLVRREFERDRVPCNCASSLIVGQATSEDATLHADTCPWPKKLWGETKSRMVIRNAEGIRLGTPQAVLDKLVGKLTFDPLAFVNENAKTQDAILRQIVGLDVTVLEEQRKTAYERRAHFNKEHKLALARVDVMPLNERDGAPAEEIPMNLISDEMLKAEEYRKLAEEAERAVSKAETRLAEGQTHCKALDTTIEDLQNRLNEAVQRGKEALASVARHEKDVEAFRITAESARAVVPDVAVIRQKLTDAEAINRKVRAKKAWMQALSDANVIAEKAGKEDDAVKAAEKAKEDALRAVTFPVEGLGLSDRGVTFNGLPFSQASTAEQIRTSVAIGFALNPGLKLLLVRNGNALDEDSLQIVADQASAAGGQILMEYVTRDANDVSVFIEDGHVAVK